VTTQIEFEAALRLALEHAVSWRTDGPRFPAISPASRDQLRKQLDIGLSDNGKDGEEVITALVRAVEGGLATNTHPNFYAWVQGSSHPVGVAADLLTSSWGQNAAIYQTAPAAAIAEETAAAWLLDLLRLPNDASMAFSTGATMASFICLSAARSEVLHRVGYNLEQDGLFGAPPVSVLLGEEAHATIFSDLRYLGFGARNIVRVAVDEQGRMLAADLKAKLVSTDGPKIVITQAGHINSGAFDPFPEIIAASKEHKAWVHVDGAFGLWARSVPTLAPLAAGLEDADSWTVDGHKWLQVPYDSGFAIIRHPAAHRRAMDITASYLVNHDLDGRNPSQFSPELSRRARGFAVWAVLQALGRNGVQEMVLRHCQCALHLSRRLADIPDIRILNEVVLNQIAIAFGDEKASLEDRDKWTGLVVQSIREENLNFVLGAYWRDQAILRVSVISLHTDISHMDVLADSIIRAWDAVRPE